MDASDERDVIISVRQLLLSAVFAGFIHVAACVNDFVLFIVNNILLYRQTILFIHSATDGYLGCVHLLSIVFSETRWSRQVGPS